MGDATDSRGRKFLLAIDTCGPTGSVALGEFVGGHLKIVGQTELAGRTYSATLVSSVGELLAQAGVGLSMLHAMVVVNGPGSFTGVRVGLSAAKGFAEAGDGIPVIPVSRLEVLTSKGGVGAGVGSAALDAHRGEIFLRIAVAGAEGTELLTGAGELAAIQAPKQIVVCDNYAAALMKAAWPFTELVLVDAPTAADALALCAPRIARGECVDLALLDGHYLRRSDAEIFGAPMPTEPESA